MRWINLYSNKNFAIVVSGYPSISISPKTLPKTSTFSENDDIIFWRGFYRLPFPGVRHLAHNLV